MPHSETGRDIMAGRRVMVHPQQFRRSGSRRQSVWLQFLPAQTIMTATGGTIIFSLNAAALALRPFTVVRSHWELQLQSDQAAAIERQLIGFGTVIVSDEASTAGVASIPTPVTEAGSDLWFLHRFVFADESNLTDRTRSGTRMTIDSKAMRKCDIGQDLLVVAELSGLLSQGVNLESAGRVLVKVA